MHSYLSDNNDVYMPDSRYYYTKVANDISFDNYSWMLWNGKYTDAPKIFLCPTISPFCAWKYTNGPDSFHENPSLNNFNFACVTYGYNRDFLGGFPNLDTAAKPFKATLAKDVSIKVVLAETYTAEGDASGGYGRGIGYFSVAFTGAGTIQQTAIVSPHDGGGSTSRSTLKGSANLLMMDGHVENIQNWLPINKTRPRLNYYNPLKSDYTD